jgi:protein-S-isoprenylcysteine O-methyltransferase Ste14
MKLAAYLFSTSLLLSFAYMVFRRIVRRSYGSYGHLPLIVSVMQLLVFLAYFGFPYLFNPPYWPWFWRAGDASDRIWQFAGTGLIIVGFAIAFGTMAWFGIIRAFGLSANELITQGPYKICRNPQIIGSYLLVFGIALQWPSPYAFGWVLMFALISHWMIITEEEHLSRIFGEEYKGYCSEVPRYVIGTRKRRHTSA